MPGKNRQKQLKEKRERKKRAMLEPGSESNYAKKRKFLARNGGWGMDYPTKPWKSGK